MENEYKIYLKIENKILTLPIPPQEFTIQYPTSHNTYDILSLGEVIVPRQPDLMTVSIESYFPANKNDALRVEKTWKEPAYYVNMVYKAMENKEVIDLVILRPGAMKFDTNISAVITDFQTTEKGGEVGDIYYTISFSEYREYKPRKIKSKSQKAGRTKSGSKKSRSTKGKLCVGATVVVNGKYFYTSHGAKPTGTANNVQTTITRIVNDTKRNYPIHVGKYGWVKKEQLRVIK